MSERGSFRSGELARLAGVSRDTLRHYERKGVLGKPRRAVNGYREYPADALDRVKLIRRALSVGFTLDELARILREREAGGAPCREVLSLATRKLSEVEARLSDLKVMRNELRNTIKHWDARLLKVAPGARAGLLESLASNGTTRPLSPSHHFEKLKKRRSKK